MDFLGRLMNSMDKPPSLSEKEKERIKKEKVELQKREDRIKDRLRIFRKEVEQKVNELCESEERCLKFPPMDKIFRSVVHEIADEAGVRAFSFGLDGIDRYIVVYKKENIPCEDELNALRQGEEWNEQKAVELAAVRERENCDRERALSDDMRGPNPNRDYRKKYQHLIGLESAKDAARATVTNKQYGFVPSKNKKDVRSIEQTLADIQSKKRMKLNHE